MRKNAGTSSRAKGLVTIGASWVLAAGLSVASMLTLATPTHDSPGTKDARPDAQPARDPAHHSAPTLDRTGRKQLGIASYYAKRYAGRKMADGTPMRLYGSNAASLTLPLGTTALVTNLETGRSGVVTIRDRGPYVKGRIIDVSLLTARQIGLGPRQGLAQVVVTPLKIPLLDGTVRVL